ncbi:unnamed protein product, partial [Strongylus vulgaris]
MRRTDDRWTLRTLKWIPREVVSRETTDQMGDVARMDQLNSQLVTSNGSGPREGR